MYILNDLTKVTIDEKLRVAARDQLRGRAYAARRARTRGSSARRLADLRVLPRRRGPGLLGGTVNYMMIACPGPSIGRPPGGSSVDAESWAAPERAIIGYVYGKRG